MSLPDSKFPSFLESFQTPQHAFCFLELDNTPQLAALLGLDITLEENVRFLSNISQKIAQTAEESISGLVLDPVYSFSLAHELSQPPALLFRLEHLAEEVDPLSVPVMIHNWGIENIKNNYAAAKLEMFYHPHEEKALEKKQLIAEIAEYARHESVPFLLKLTLYTPVGEEFSPVAFQEAQIMAVQEFRDQCDVLVLQYAQDALACATLTAELDVPWLLTAQGVKYEEYKEMLRTSLENGARGFLVGSVLWQELANLKSDDKSPDKEAINRFIETTFRDRLIEVRRIVEETYVKNS